MPLLLIIQYFQKANSIRSILSAHIDLKSRFELLFPINAVTTLSDPQVPQIFLANATIALVLHSRLPATSVSLPTTLTSLPAIPNEAIPPIPLDQHKILIMEQLQLHKQQQSKLQMNASPTTSVPSSFSSSSSFVYNTSNSNNKNNNNNNATIVPPLRSILNTFPYSAPTTTAVSSSSYSSSSSTTCPKVYPNKSNNNNTNNSKNAYVDFYDKNIINSDHFIKNTNPINNNTTNTSISSSFSNNNNNNSSYLNNPRQPLPLVQTTLSIDQQ